MFWRWVRRYLTFVAVATGALFGLVMVGAAVLSAVSGTPPKYDWLERAEICLPISAGLAVFLGISRPFNRYIEERDAS